MNIILPKIQLFILESLYTAAEGAIGHRARSGYKNTAPDSQIVESFKIRRSSLNPFERRRDLVTHDGVWCHLNNEPGRASGRRSGQSTSPTSHNRGRPLSRMALARTAAFLNRDRSVNIPQKRGGNRCARAMH